MKKEREATLRTLLWLLRDFTLLSMLKVFFYYFKKKTHSLNFENTFYITFRFEGKKIKFLLRENNDDFAIIREVFLFKAYEVAKKKKFKTVVDCGSHIGSTAIYFSKKYRPSKIICFEPEENSRNLLMANLALNKVNATVLDYGISNKRETLKFFSDKKNPAYSKINNEGNKEIKTISLDEVIEFLSIGKIDLVKMDIEGYEIKAIKGLKKNLKNIGSFIFEVHHDMYDSKVLFSSLEKENFRICPPLKQWKILSDEEFPLMIAVRKS